MIIVKLRAAMESYRHRSDRRITYAELAERTGISTQTLSSIGSRRRYRPGLDTIEKLCRALNVPLHEMLEMIDDPPKRKASPRKQKKKP